MKAIDPFFEKLERALDVMSRRQQLLASNVGNLDTPGYHAVDIDFDRTLQQAVNQAGEGGIGLRQTLPGHLGTGQGTAAVDARELEGLAFRPDGNNVNIDREMAELAATRHRYEVTATVLRTRLRQIRAAIMDGKSV